MDRTIKGKFVTDEQISEWVEEAEKGFNVERLRKRGRGRPGRASKPSQVIAVRFTQEEIEKLDEMAAEQHLTRSELIRKEMFA